MKHLSHWNFSIFPTLKFLRTKHPPSYFFVEGAFILLIWLVSFQPIHSQINDDGAVHAVGTAGTYTDIFLPNNSQIVAIKFTLKGGDGGYANVHDAIPVVGPSYSYTSNGGQGATTTATFPVGSGVGQIPLGSYIRFVRGVAGQSGSSGGVLGYGFDYGGGGGGSAVLYSPTGSAPWTLLAVAGGGGGAYQGMASYIRVDSENGQGGLSGTGGGSGNGDLGIGGGGLNGSGGGGNDGFAGGGGGSNSDGGGIVCISFEGSSINGEGGKGGNSIGYGGWSEGCTSFTWRNGGAGYGGGGAGSGTGGGGGGYSGGGAGGTTGRGGGGGSFVAAGAISPGVTAGGSTGSPSNGTLSYQVTLNEPPVAYCKSVTIYLDAGGNATLTAAQVNNGSTDSDGTIASMSLSKTSFDCSNVGITNTVTLTVTDNNGATATCDATITVVDDLNPDALCQNITVYLNANGNVSITADMIDNGSTDNCSIASKTLDISSFTCANVGPNTVELTVNDPSGNDDKCSATVTVVDTISPIAVCQNITVQLDMMGNVSITANDIDNGSTDACGIAFLEASITDFTCDDVGPNTVTLTVTDNNGNTSTCMSTVTVEDNVPPAVVCQNITIQLDNFGKASIVATDIDNGSTDACGVESYAASRYDFTCVDLGNNNVVLTVTDVNENIATCNANVLVEDNIRPNVRTRNVTVVLDEYGEGYVTPDMIDNGSTDNCSISYMWLEGEISYDCGNTGEHEVVLKAVDQSGNIGSWNAFVTVKFYEPDFRNIHGVANGDTVHVADCQVPWDISRYDVDYETIIQHGTLTTQVYKEELPENAPWGMYAVWRYEYVVKDACYHTYKFNYYLALYDLEPPIYTCFPRDTTVGTSADVPEVDKKVKIVDVCQYVVWDTVVTMPVLDQQSGDTLGYTRRWMARDPSGHESFNDQMIWLGSGDRNLYSLITGRLADENHIANAKFAGEAGTNGLPVSLYRLDTVAGTRTWIDSWTTGDWMGAQGKYYFVPEHPGSYQVKIDTAICLVDTLKFNKWLWSDTLRVVAGESLDQGWIITHDCIETDTTIVEDADLPESLVGLNEGIRSQVQSHMEWRIYPTPSQGYLKIDVNRDDEMNYRIYDALGRSVKSGVYQQGQTIDIHGLNAGLYHLQLLDKKNILGTKRVLLMK